MSATLRLLLVSFPSINNTPTEGLATSAQHWEMKATTGRGNQMATQSIYCLIACEFLEFLSINT